MRCSSRVRVERLVGHCLSEPKNIAQFILNVLMGGAERACLSPFFCSCLVLIARWLKAVNSQTLQFWNVALSLYRENRDPFYT